MLIGLDFDNTIVNYDALFYKVAIEWDVVNQSVSVSKRAVRDFLRAVDKEDIWTEMQGYVYGVRMEEAEAYPGVFSFIQRMQAVGHQVAIISHKTKYPFMGPQYDLHASALTWVKRYLCEKNLPLIPDSYVFFEVTKEDKWARIAKLSCDVFIDDLPEILLSPQFPSNTQRLLFDPESYHINEIPSYIRSFASWATCENNLL